MPLARSLRLVPNDRQSILVWPDALPRPAGHHDRRRLTCARFVPKITGNNRNIRGYQTGFGGLLTRLISLNYCICEVYGSATRPPFHGGDRDSNALGDANIFGLPSPVFRPLPDFGGLHHSLRTSHLKHRTWTLDRSHLAVETNRTPKARAPRCEMRSENWIWNVTRSPGSPP